MKSLMMGLKVGIETAERSKHELNSVCNWYDFQFSPNNFSARIMISNYNEQLLDSIHNKENLNVLEDYF